ncbi:MAG: hypothetical protein EBZ96_09280, partial [Synechococcaceae bacterium WB9_3_282]|nr:hypothetical protein [Synechococcaceae bacterium WB9_3_282]
MGSGLSSAAGFVAALIGRVRTAFVSCSGLSLLSGTRRGPRNMIMLRPSRLGSCCSSALSSKSLASAHQLLSQADPLAAGRIHPSDKIRTQRALEVLYGTGKPLSSQ